MCERCKDRFADEMQNLGSKLHTLSAGVAPTLGKVTEYEIVPYRCFLLCMRYKFFRIDMLMLL